MGITLSILWIIICAGTLYYAKVFKAFGIKSPVLVCLFLFKVTLGYAYWFIHLRYYGGGDSVDCFNQSAIIQNTLYTHPAAFVKLLFTHPVPPTADILVYTDQMPLYTDTSTYFLIRAHVFFRFLSGGHFSVHVVLYNFIITWGMLYLYAFCRNVLGKQSWIVLAVLFLMPSAAFWVSGFHKDGFELCGLGLILYSVQKMLDKRYSFIDILRLLTGVWLMAEARAYVLFILLACLTAYIVAAYISRRTIWVFVATLLVLFGVALLTQFLSDDYNVIYNIWYRQGTFMYLNHGNTNLALPEMERSTTGLLKILPYAFENVFLHPNIFELLTFFMVGDFIINIFHVVILIISIILIFSIRLNKRTTNAILLLIVSGFISALFYGIIVSNVGALSRYRSVPMLMIWLGYSLIISTYMTDKPITQRINKVLFS